MTGRAVAVVGTAGSAVGLLTGSAAPWLTAEVSTAISTEVLAVPGSTVVRSVPAAALVLLACALALALAGRLARLVVAAVVTGVGALVVATTTTFLADPAPAAAGALAAATGVGGADVAPELTVWPVVVTILGVLVAVGGVLVAALSRRWTSATSGRYEATPGMSRPGGAQGGAPAVSRTTDDWDALSRGDDPS